MAIIYSYPTVIPTANDLVLGTDVDQAGKPTKNFTIQSIVDIVQQGATGLAATLALGNDAGNQAAIGFTNLIGTGTVTFGGFTDGTMTITTGTGAGFTSITSTDFVGNITGVVKAGSSIAGTVTGVTQAVGTSNTTLATTAYVMNKVDPSVLQYLGDATGPFNLNLVSDDFKISGTANQIETTATTVGGNVGTINLKFPTAGVVLPDGSTATTQAATDDSTKVATTAFVRDYDDTQDLDFTDGTTASTVLLNSQTLTLEGTADQITTAVTAQKVKFSLPSSVEITGTYTGTTFSGDLNGTVNTLTTGVTQTAGNNSTKIATTAYVDAAAGAKTLSYQADAAGTGTMPFTMNLSTDDLDIAGGNNINTSTLAVTAGVDPKAVITVNLDDSVTISGTMTAGTLSDGTFSGTAGTYTGGVSIESDTFTATTTPIGFIGNATTATGLAAPGTIQLLSGSGATQGVASSAVTYTSGGNVELTTALANTTVTGKTLQGLPTPAAATVVAGDTILEGIGKLQSQINGIANGLQFQGTWNANIDEGGAGAAPNGTPALTSGGGEASSGTTDATTANELVDSTKNFTAAPNIVAVGDKVINQVDGQEALVNDIANAASGRLGLAADIMLTAEAYIIDKPPFITAGHYYVVDTVGATTAKNATLNGIQDWQVGDWVIASINNVWQKLNNSAVEGSGTENRLTKWAAAASTLVDSGIIDNGTTIKLENDTELGGAAGDAISSVGVHTIDEQLILKKGLALNASYGTSGQVLTSAGASADVPTWTTPTTGTVTSVGLTETGDALTITGSPVTSSGTINIAGAGSASQYINGELNLVTFPTVDNYVSWTLAGDTGSSQTISSTNTATIAGGTGIVTAASATDTLTVNIDTVGTDNAIEVLTAATAATGDFMWFSDIDDSNTLRKSTLANLPFSPTLSGTQYTIPMFATTSTLGDSMVTQNAGGTAATISGTLTTTGSFTSTLGTFSDKVVISSSSQDVLTIKRTNGNPAIAFGGITGDTAVATISCIGTGTNFGTITFYSNSGTLANPNYLQHLRFRVDSALNSIMEIGKGNGGDGKINCEGSVTIDIDNNNSATGKFFSVVTHANTGSPIELLKVKDDGIVQMPDYGSGTNTGTPTYNLEVDSSGNIIETSSTPGGSGGGIFSGDQAIITASTSLAFTLNRATTGALIFDVWLTSETSTGTSVTKKYTVAHSNNATPVYNKIIDTGLVGSNDFLVTFLNAGSGLSVTCNIQAVGVAQNIGYTVQVGHDSTNALTFTAAS